MTDISFYYISLSYLYTSMSCLRQNKTLARFVTAVYKKITRVVRVHRRDLL